MACPWKIDKPARVTLFWFSWPSKKKGGRDFWRPLFPRAVTLTESDRDDIELYENYIDTRAFFKIDVEDREGIAKTEREKITREINENLNKLRSLGFDPSLVPPSIFAAMEEKPRERLTLKEKEALEAFLKAFDLSNRLGLLKAWNDDQSVQWFIQSVKNAPAMTQYLLKKEAPESLQGG